MQISKTEEAIKSSLHRIQALEKKLESYDFPPEKKKEIKRELVEAKKLLLTNENQLSSLHKHNRKSFIFVAILCFIISAIYSVYVLLQNENVSIE